MKKTISIFAAAFALCLCAAAQTTEDFLTRYNALTSRVGYAGIGVETLIQKWKVADPEDINHMVASFNFYLAKSMRDSVVKSYRKNYLDLDPIVSLKDSAGVNVYYFNEKIFDRENFSKAMDAVDQAIGFDNTRLDIVLMKLDALVSYEKTIPDNGRDLLLNTLNTYFAGKRKFTVPSLEVNDDNFLPAVQRYCLGYYNIGSPQALETFKAVSERVVKSRPKAVDFINNIGAYYVAVAKDDKKASKYYGQVLKIEPGNPVASQNMKLIQRRAAAAAAAKARK